MKIEFRAALRSLLLVGMSALDWQVLPSLAAADENSNRAKFPYVIPFETGSSAFASGDSITISSVMGDRPHLEPEGSYLVQGSYALASADHAGLLLSCTSRNPSGPTPITDGQKTSITRGSGTFSLEHAKLGDGWLHVSFYAANEGHSHGGIYFGEKGNERTVLRQMNWPDFSLGHELQNPPLNAANRGTDPQAADPANLAILAYLGKPVPAPARLPANYMPTNLLAAFASICQKASWHVRKLAADDSEFPHLVFGLLAGKHDFREIEKGLRELTDYSYSGSVVGTTDDGSTYFSLNMIPAGQYPSGLAEACNRRLMVRLQMLADTARRWQ
jgi:hypothetical protein